MTVVTIPVKDITNPRELQAWLNSNNVGAIRSLTMSGNNAVIFYDDLKSSVTNNNFTTSNQVSLTFNAQDDAIVFPVGNYAGAAFSSGPGNLVGSIVAEASLDNGATWITTFFIDPYTGIQGTALGYGDPNTNNNYSFTIPPGATHIRARASVYTSGNVTGIISGSLASNASYLNLGLTGLANPRMTALVGGAVNDITIKNFNVNSIGELHIDRSDRILYAASTNGTVSTGTTAATVTSLAYLWHPAAVSKSYEILDIFASFAAGSAGDFTLRGAFISAENGAPGGTVQTINATDRSQAASGGTFRTGAAAPTRVAGDLFCSSHPATGNGQWLLYDEQLLGKPIILRANVAEGFEIRSVVGAAITTASKVSIYVIWREI